MDNNVTKNQHYVWRYYLSSWTDNGTLEGALNVFRKTQNHIRETNLDCIASGNYTYCHPKVTPADIEFINLYINRLDTKFDIVKPQLRQVIILLSNHHGRNDYYEKNLVCEVENAGASFLKKLRNGDISFISENTIRVYINDYRPKLAETFLTQTPPPEISKEIMRKAIDGNYNDSLFDFVSFVTFQFFRTRTAQKAYAAALIGMKERSDKWEDANSETIYMAMLMIDPFIMANVVADKIFKVTLLENHTNEPFIVSDTPVINLDADPGSGTIPENLRLYYPITPKIAIIIAKSGCAQNSHPDVCEVEHLNTLVFKNALNEVYSTEKTILEKYSAQ